MLVVVDKVTVALASDDERVLAEWQQLFAGHLAVSLANGEATITLSLRLCPTLPELPPGAPFFEEQAGAGLPLSAYRPVEDQILLSLPDRSQIRLAPEKPAATIWTTASVLQAGRLEDLTTIALAPLLRRHGYYMVHAFAATRAAGALLLVGGSGRGKTSTGMNLVTHGWHYLGNDVTLLQARPGGVYALPSPGGINVSRDSVTLLPQLASLLRDHDPHPADGKYHLPATVVADGSAGPLPVRVICFPEVHDTATSRLLPLSRAEALAYLMIDSVDHWDREALAGHINLLQQVTEQARCHRLILGRDVGALPTLLGSALADGD